MHRRKATHSNIQKISDHSIGYVNFTLDGTMNIYSVFFTARTGSALSIVYSDGFCMVVNSYIIGLR